MVSKGHRKAGKMGAGFEKDVIGMLRDAGFAEINKKDVCGKVLPAKWFCRQYDGFYNIYNKKWKVDILISDAERFPERLVAELKYQGVNGSVDEKFPFVVLSLKKLFTEYKTKGIFFLNGGKYSREALNWCYKQQNENLFVVEGRSDIYNWIEENL